MISKAIKCMFIRAVKDSPENRELALIQRARFLKESVDVLQSRLSKIPSIGKLEVSTRFEAAHNFMELHFADKYSIILQYVPEENVKSVYQGSSIHLRTELYIYSDRYSSSLTPFTTHLFPPHQSPGNISEFDALQSVSDWSSKLPVTAAHNVMETVREIQNTRFEKVGRCNPIPKTLA